MLCPADGMKIWSPQNTETLPGRSLAYLFVCLTTASRMVKFLASPATSTTAGNLTPGLLLFSAPGNGANLVPFPAVWYKPIDPPLLKIKSKSFASFASANFFAFAYAYKVPNPFPAPSLFVQSSHTA